MARARRIALPMLRWLLRVRPVTLRGRILPISDTNSERSAPFLYESSASDGFDGFSPSKWMGSVFIASRFDGPSRGSARRGG